MIADWPAFSLAIYGNPGGREPLTTVPMCFILVSILHGFLFGCWCRRQVPSCCHGSRFMFAALSPSNSAAAS